ncbi:MAG: hypothetical protein AYK22_08775 [Thermoplasmatales archaeon SG8-52-3]|nr:MAG: hypothetical protein AYK22_08775 [Thermoplasmatales archaeon SG8-52-3]
MNITSNSTYKIIRYILLSKEFKQVEIHNSTECSKGQVNKVVNWLLSRNFLEKGKNKYYIIDPAGIISLFPLFRNMKDLLIYRIPLRAEKDKILNNLSKEAVLCLDSALDMIKNKFKPYSGGMIDLEIYKSDMDLENDTIKGVTSKLRTVIDMTCDGKTYVAKDLFEELWGIRFG